MPQHRIVCNGSVLGKGLHRVLIWAPNPLRVRESLQEELFQQFTCSTMGSFIPALTLRLHLTMSLVRVG